MKPVYILLFARIACCFSCKNDQQSTDTIDENTRVWEPVDSYIEGVYEGNLPCTDCDERQMKVKLNMDQSAMTTIARVGSNEDATTSIGQWQLNGDVVTITNSGSSLYFQAKPDELVEMASATKPRNNKQAKEYTLRKVN